MHHRILASMLHPFEMLQFCVGGQDGQYSTNLYHCMYLSEMNFSLVDFGKNRKDVNIL